MPALFKATLCCRKHCCRPLLSPQKRIKALNPLKTSQAPLAQDLDAQHGNAHGLRSEPLKTPSLLRRMACWCYEGMLLFAVLFIAGYLFSGLTQTRHALDNRLGQQAFLLLILGIYFTWFWSKGQTLAMKTWNIRLVDRYGHNVTQKRALLRFALSWLWFLPPLAAMTPFKLSGAESALLITGWVLVWALLSRFQAQGQFLHDALAQTLLVSAPASSR